MPKEKQLGQYPGSADQYYVAACLLFDELYACRIWGVVVTYDKWDSVFCSIIMERMKNRSSAQSITALVLI